MIHKKIPFIDLKRDFSYYGGDMEKAILEVAASGRYILGPKVAQFEESVADYCGVKHAIGVASGSDALLLSLMALGISAGDEVITTPFTFFATSSAISRVGATPVFVDIEPDTFNINPELIGAAITERTKAIIPVHLFGRCANMSKIRCFIDRWHPDISIIEDAAQAFGAGHHGKKAGSMGHLGCFSFFPTKNLGCFGDGGMVVTDFEYLAEKVRKLRAHGSSPKYYHGMIGINSRLDEIQAAILLVKMEEIDMVIYAREFAAKGYTKLFEGSEVVFPKLPDENQPLFYSNDISVIKRREPKHTYNQYVIRVPHRDELKKHLDSLGISTAVYYPVPLHLQECYKSLGYRKGDFPEAEKACEEVLALPIYAIDHEDQKWVAGAILSYLATRKASRVVAKPRPGYLHEIPPGRYTFRVRQSSGGD